MSTLNFFLMPISISLILLLLVAIFMVVHVILKTKRASILVVDDEPEFCEHLKSFLVEKNFQVRVASTVEEAKRLINQEEFDYVTVDLMMKTENTQCGEWGGIEIFNLLKVKSEQLQESKSDVKMKIIVLSAYSLSDVAKEYPREAYEMQKFFISKGDPNRNYILAVLEMLKV